jgi:hypothetical protein
VNDQYLPPIFPRTFRDESLAAMPEKGLARESPDNARQIIAGDT